MTDEVRLSEDIPETPPECEEDYRRQLWQMARESYRIAKQYDYMTQRATWLFTSIVGFLLTVAGLFAFWEWFRGVLKKWVF